MGRRIFVNVRFQIRPVRSGTDRAHILPDFAATAETGQIVHTSGRDPQPCCARSGHRHGEEARGARGGPRKHAKRAEEAGAAPNHIPIHPPRNSHITPC